MNPRCTNRRALLRLAVPALCLAAWLPGCTLLPQSAPAAATAPADADTAGAPAVPAPVAPSVENPRVELLWDTWGVPHIFAEDEGALFYAKGRAQMRSHANLLLRLYGQARGRAAEYWGEDFVDSDTWVRINGVPERAERWLAMLSPHMRAYLEAFVDGANAFAEENADAIAPEWRAVLPLTVTDVLAHQQRVLNYTFMANPAMAAGVSRQWQQQAGSNAWAVAPSRSASGNALLLINPHLPWGDLFTWYEMHVVAPGVDAYGATLVGFPILSLGFNQHLGWAHTVNTIDSADIYELTLAGDGYVLDGTVREFEVERQTLLVRMPDGSVQERPLDVRRSVHGPVIAMRDGRALALRVAGLETAGLAEQYWDMLRSTNRSQFEAALARLQLPMFTVMYADRHGDIMHVFNGDVPVRPRGDWAYWQGIVPGDSSSTLWTDSHHYYGLPRVLNPESGWLQNANDPPWTTTLPLALQPRFFPPYMAPDRPLSFRAQRSARMLAETPRMTLDRMVELKHSTRMGAADHLVQDVVAAARSLGGQAARDAADVLEAWDRTTDAGSRGAVLFSVYFRMLQQQRWPTGSVFELPWSPQAPLSTPDGLSDARIAVELLGRAAERVRSLYGSLDVPWGDVYRLPGGDGSIPANGGGGEFGIFRVVGFEPMPDDSTRFVAASGDSFVAAIEFSQPVRARVVTTYGNASQPGSPHRGDQLQLFAGKRTREAWLTRAAIMQNLSLRERF